MSTSPAALPPTIETTSPDASTPQVGEGARRHALALRRRLVWSIPPWAVVMVLSMVPALQFTGWQWVAALLSLPVVTWGAWPFHRAAFQAGRHGSTTMDTLVSLGVIASTLWSWWALLFGGAGTLGMRMTMSLLPRAAAGGHADIYFEGACTIVVFLLTGRYFEARTRYRAGDALRALLELGAKDATLVRIDPVTGARTETVIPASDLALGDLFLVRPGEKVATDGRVEDGASALDTSLLTGESVPVDVSAGDEVTGATVNTWGTLTVRATRVGSETTLAQIGRMVTEAQAGKAPVQRLADRISAVFVPVVIVIALVTLAGWLLAGASVQAAFTSAVAVLVVACPCALGLATPTALLVGSGRASQLGVLIKSAEILEQTRTIDTVVLDKTGTVTTGRMSLESVILPTSVPDTDEGARRALALAAAAESGSEHPVARAVVGGAQQREVTAVPSSSFTNHAGLGVSALVDRPDASSESPELVLVGRATWLADHGITLPADLAHAVHEAETSGASAVVLATVPDWHEVTGPDAGGPSDAALSAAEDPGLIHIDMDVQGMTCASCVGRVERKLKKLPGVTANVNLATESASITLDRDYSDEELEQVVNNAGYQGRVLRRSEGSSTATAVLERPVAATSAGGARVLPPHIQGGIAQAVLVVRDTVKETSALAISQLRELGIEPVLLTGDNEAAARHVADQVGIDRVIAQVLPEKKRDIVADLQQEGRVVAMVGDGVNDAAALAQASNRGLGIAMGSGTDVAIQVADITLVNSELTAVSTAIRVSRRTLRIIKENLFWAFFYNVLMIPLAVSGLLNPMIAAAAMAFSSVFVVLNSLRLRSAS